MDTIETLKSCIRMIPDFPKPGINFYDITSLLANPVAFRVVLDQFVAQLEAIEFTKIVGIEARGFIFASALAARLQKPLVLVRKPGKLPGRICSQAYDLEYGTNCLEIHSDSIEPNDQVVIVDDFLATGGTVLATCQLIEQLHGKVATILALAGLTFLPFQQKLEAYSVSYLFNYEQ